MKTLRVRKDPDGNALIESLPLPFLDGEGAPIGDGAEYSNFHGPIIMTEAHRVRTARYTDGMKGPKEDFADHRLILVASGNIEIMAARSKATLIPGDVFYIEDVTADEIDIVYRGDANSLVVDVDPSWVPSGETPSSIDDNQPGVDVPPHTIAMCSDHTGQKSYLSDHPGLWPENPGLSEPLPIAGIRFRSVAGGVVGQWHCHPTNSMIVLLEGYATLTVNRAQPSKNYQAPGTVNLVLERTGEGHTTDYNSQHLRSADLLLFDDHLPTPPQQP